MNVRPAIPTVLITALLVCIPACAGTKNPHFFPRLQPLFAGLDETKIRPEAKAALVEAKEDFRLARRDKEPRHARYVRTLPNSDSKVYEGRGYRVTIVHNWAFYGHSDGPEIEIGPSITGGKPFHYGEVNELSE